MSPILNIYGQEKPDLVFELEGVDNTKVKQLIINNDTVWNEICTSNQCRIQYTYTFFSEPNPESNIFHAGYHIEFNLIDDITHADVSPVKKKFMERFGLGLGICIVKNVDDIVETNNTVIYNCAPDTTSISRTHDKTLWNFNVKGTYDSAKENLKISGKYTGVGKGY